MDFTTPPVEPHTPIDTNRITSLAYWSARFQVTDREVIAAVEVVGPLAERVERYLKSSASWPRHSRNN